MFVANTSHWLQPLDEAPFRNFKKYIYAKGEENIWDALMTNGKAKTTREAFLQAAFDAENIAFKPRTIINAFKNCGVWPLNEDRILELARLNLGVFRTDINFASEAASQAATAVIKASFARQKEIVCLFIIYIDILFNNFLQKEKSVNGSARVKSSTLYHGRDLVHAGEAHQRGIEEKAREKQERLEKKQSNKRKREDDRIKAAELTQERTCRSTLCSSVWRGGKGWGVCSKCERFVLCRKCKNVSKWHDMFQNHVLECIEDMETVKVPRMELSPRILSQ